MNVQDLSELCGYIQAGITEIEAVAADTSESDEINRIGSILINHLAEICAIAYPQESAKSWQKRTNAGMSDFARDFIRQEEEEECL